jgi:hypothetical protein
MVSVDPRQPSPRKPDGAARTVIASAGEESVRELSDRVLEAVVGGGGPIAPARLAELLRRSEG